LESGLERKLGLSPQEIREALALLEEVAKDVEPAKRNIRITGVCRDEPDQAILEAAVASRAEFIVTGDRDLLGLKEFRKIRILTSREFELMFD